MERVGSIARMGNCLCKCSWAPSNRQPCGGTKHHLVKSLLLCAEAKAGDEGDKALSCGGRKKVDGLIGADLFLYYSLSRGLRMPQHHSGVAAMEESYRVIHDLLGSHHHVYFYVVTWNMNGKVSLRDVPRLIQHGKGPSDFYVVGLQEAPKFDVAALILGVLGHEFSLVASSTMTSLGLYIFTKISLHTHISDIKMDKVGLRGLGGVMRRQKGAVAASFKFKEASFLFIASHLSPHEGNVEERNSQYQRITQSLFSTPAAEPYSCLRSSGGGSGGAGEGRHGAEEGSDVVIWVGDLNYRVECNRGMVDYLITRNLHKSLRCKDQLCREVMRGNVFYGYCEGPLCFRPTYKYDIGSDNYDTSPKKRVPSWTDRILYKVRKPSPLKAYVYEYDSISFVRSSDHRPVKALLKLKGL